MPDNTPTPIPGRAADADVPASAQMDDTLRKRREETWDMLVVKGFDYGEVRDTLAEKYDVAPSTIETDIGRMDDWLPKLTQLSAKDGTSRLRELRKNRQRRQQLALEARREENFDREQRLLNDIDKSLKLDIKLSQSLGKTDREAQEHVTRHEGQVEHELSDQQREHISQLQDWARGQVPERDDTIEVENLAETDDGDSDATPPE